MEQFVKFSLDDIAAFIHAADTLTIKIESLRDDVDRDEEQIIRYLDQNVINARHYLEAAQKESEACVEAYGICERKVDHIDRMLGETESEINRLARIKSEAYDNLQRAKSDQTRANAQ